MRGVMLGVVVLGSIAANVAMAQDKPPMPPTIQVLGKGSVEDAPDVAHISFGVRGEGKSSDDALKALVARKQAVENALASQPGAKLRIETGAVEIAEVRGRDCRGADEDEDTPRLSTGACAVQGYVATMDMGADVGSVDIAGTLTGLASRAGASGARLSGFRLGEPSDARRRAIAAAVANGREQAQLIAAASGGKLGALVRVSDPQSGYGGGADEIVVTGMVAESVQRLQPVTVSIAPGKITTSAQLVLVYEIVR